MEEFSPVSLSDYGNLIPSPGACRYAESIGDVDFKRRCAEQLERDRHRACPATTGGRKET